jgi:hypothetical protein
LSIKKKNAAPGNMPIQLLPCAAPTPGNRIAATNVLEGRAGFRIGWGVNSTRASTTVPALSGYAPAHSRLAAPILISTATVVTLAPAVMSFGEAPRCTVAHFLTNQSLF